MGGAAIPFSPIVAAYSPAMIPSASSASIRFPYRLRSQVLNFVTLENST